MIMRDLILKKNMLKIALAEGKISKQEYEIAIKRIEERIANEIQRQDDYKSNLNLFRKKMLNR